MITKRDFILRGSCFCEMYNLIRRNSFCMILAPERIGNLNNIKTNMFDYDVCVLIGWLVQSIC